MFRKEEEYCEACGSYPCATDCPSSLVDDDINSSLMRSIFLNYVPNTEILNEDIAEAVGKHLLLIADAVLDAQKKWEYKTYMEKLDDVMNGYSSFINFTESLNKANAFDSVDEVIDFMKHPKKWNKLFNYWYEVYNPIVKSNMSQKDIMWEIFQEKVLEQKNLIKED